MHHASRHLFCSVILMALASTPACRYLADPGEAIFEVAQVTQHEECMNAAFPFEPNFFAARQRRTSIGLFLQSRGGLDTDFDLVQIELYEPAFIHKNLGRPIPLSIPNAPDPIARATVLLRESCEDLWEGFYLTGAVIIDVLDLDDDRRVEGSFSGASLVKTRTNEVVAGEFQGSWAYDVLRGPPHEEFFPPGN
ncbi:MAG: hypothetical protein ACNA8W_24465 [Bradymonadaceae bacterium]